MRNGRLTVRRRRFWSLLVGALGGAACSGEAWAADNGSRSEPAQRLSESPSALRLSPQLGEQRKAGQRKPVHDAWRPAASELPLRLSLSIMLQSKDAASVPRTVAVSNVKLSEAGRAASAEITADGDSDSGPVRPEKPAPFEPTAAVAGARRAIAVAAQSVGSPAKQTDSGLPDLSGESWGMAPIRWAGTTGTSGNFFSSPDGQDSWNIRNTLNVQASSFIGAPYIAQWTGLLGTDSDRAEFTGATGATSRVDSSGKDIGGSINVFPLSNFPFSANFSHRTSDVKFGQNRAPITNTSFGLSQQYRTDGGDAYSATYTSNRYEVDSNSSHNSVLSGNVSVRRAVDDPEHFLDGNHILNASVTFIPSDSDVGGQTRRELNANISHNWWVHEDLSLNNMLTLVGLQEDAFSGNNLSNYDSRLLIATTNFNWRPIEDMPLTLSGGGSFSQTSQTLLNQTTNQQALAANLSTSYRFSNNLSASGNTFLASISTDGGRFTSGGAGVSASYAADPLKFGEYLYNWNLGGGVNANFSSEGDNFFNLSTSVGHNLARTFVIDKAQAVSLNASQTLSFNQLQDGSATVLSHNLGTAWNAAYGEALTANMSANVSDIISTGQTQDNHYAYINLAGMGRYQISSRSALSLNISANRSETFEDGSLQRQSVVNGVISSGDQSQWSGSVSLGYVHSSPFSIPNLNYNATLLWVNNAAGSVLGITSTQGSGTRLARSSSISNQEQSISFQQLLDYRIGRLTFRLNHAMIEQAGRKSASIFGSVNREFDGFFDGRW